MDIQFLLGIIIGVIAILYLFRRFKIQLHQIENDLKCEDCPILEDRFINNNKK